MGKGGVVWGEGRVSGMERKGGRKEQREGEGREGDMAAWWREREEWHGKSGVGREKGGAAWA